MGRRELLLAAGLLLAACGASEPKEGALSSDEERQLNEAAAMLDEPAAPAEGGAENAAEPTGNRTQN